jgi:hypothetical protein
MVAGAPVLLEEFGQEAEISHLETRKHLAFDVGKDLRPPSHEILFGQLDM